MFCPQCGKENPPQARFCHDCGSALPADAGAPAQPPQDASPAPVAPAAPAQVTRTQVTAAAVDPTPAPVPAPASGDAVQGDVAEQVKQARGRTRRKIPVVMLVILVALACASAAFAAHYVYTNFIAPALEQQEKPAAKKTEEKTEEKAEPEDPEKAQKAVFNDVLSAYQGAQANGWPATSFDDTLSSLSEIKGGRQLYQGTAHPYYYDQNEELKYAYADLNSDGTLELLIAAINGEEYAPVEIYANNGGAAQRVGAGSQDWPFVYPTLFKSGEISIGSRTYGGGASYFHIESDGTLTLDASLTNEQILTGQSTIGDLGDKYAVGDFTWTALADFAEVK